MRLVSRGATLASTLIAAEWIAGKQAGMYSMKEVLGLDFLKTGE